MSRQKIFQGSKKGRIKRQSQREKSEDIWELTLERLIDDWDAQIWDIPNVKNNHPEKINHPCQFPVELAERCVLALTNSGDVVYDPFAGVGSSLIAALKNERIAWGSEREKVYVDAGLERIKKLREGTLIMRRYVNYASDISGNL
ncbi:MAG: site-specific DNA-methyltransferase [Synergistaceae bacterium]|nr:site-specific DNA-methyltransferase [Synergistaceae bacterium]